MRRAREHLARVSALAVLLTACGPDTPSPEHSRPPADDGAATAPQESSPPQATAPMETPAAGHEPLDEQEAAPEPVTEPTSGPWEHEDFPAWGEDPVRLVGARLLAPGDLDRLVLEFDGQVPTWEVREVQPPVLEQPMGNEVDIRGDDLLELRLVPSTTLDRGATDPMAAYEGPWHLEGTGQRLVEALLTGDHGDLVVWSLGLHQPGEVAVSELDGPPRLVVDLVDGT